MTHYCRVLAVFARPTGESPGILVARSSRAMTSESGAAALLQRQILIHVSNSPVVQIATPLRSRGSAEPEVCSRRFTARGGGAPVGAEWWSLSRGLRSLARRRSGAPTAASFEPKDRASGTERACGLSPASSRPVQPLKAAAARSSGGRWPSTSRTMCVRDTPRRTPHPAGRRRIARLRRPSPASLPADDLSRFQAPSRSAPHGQDIGYIVLVWPSVNGISHATANFMRRRRAARLQGARHRSSKGRVWTRRRCARRPNG